jgi:hypothetical protein
MVLPPDLASFAIKRRSRTCERFRRFSESVGGHIVARRVGEVTSGRRAGGRTVRGACESWSDPCTSDEMRETCGEACVGATTSPVERHGFLQGLESEHVTGHDASQPANPVLSLFEPVPMAQLRLTPFGHHP